MNEAILRGFDFLAADLTDRLRFCNPILSFSKQNDAPLYLARDLSWEFHEQSYSDSLTTVDSDILDSFATRVADISQTIKSDEGVIVMGSKFFAAASFAGVDLTALTKTEFREIPDLRCHIAVSDAHTFEQFAQELVHMVSSVVDSELRLVSDGGLSGGDGSAPRRPHDPGDRSQARGSSESGERLEAAGAGRFAGTVRRRVQPPAEGPRRDHT